MEIKKVLLVTDGFFHPPLLARRTLHSALAKLNGFEFQNIHSMEKLPDNLRDISALVIYIHHKKISKKALKALDDYVSNGGGILGIHSSTASFKEESHYFEILGGQFTGHGPVARFDVKPATDNGLFAGISTFTVKDELYLHELQPGIEVHFTAKHDGNDIPVVWTYRYGEGRVCYAVPGHRTETMKNKNYQEVLQRGLSWVYKS